MPLLKPSRTTDDKAIFRNVDRTLIFAKKKFHHFRGFQKCFKILKNKKFIHIDYTRVESNQHSLSGR